jgi:large subunit ribosomal protein L19
MKEIMQIEKSLMRSRIPEFRAGDTVRVHVKIKEGEKERVQVFQGTVISRRGSGTGETFTVRKVSSGIGVERIFPLHSPSISKIQRTRKGKVRRAKLSYLRGLTGKSARIEELLEEKGEGEDSAAGKKGKARAARGKKEKETEDTEIDETEATADEVSEEKDEE